MNFLKTTFKNVLIKPIKSPYSSMVEHAAVDKMSNADLPYMETE